MRRLLALAVALAPLFAEDAPAPPPIPKDSLKQARHRFDLVSTRAMAHLHAADTIEARLNENGATLHPQIIALRLRIGASLEEAHSAIAGGDLKAADQAMTIAEALVDRFARRLGGE
ncbi:MAG TPA: hypothetical protein VNX18_02070 [Bryobacteraceae bacterium]|jgi:hypothetical protein|nr:hypothetical protein [Bryobacteraceae bacterium]